MSRPVCTRCAIRSFRSLTLSSTLLRPVSTSRAASLVSADNFLDVLLPPSETPYATVSVPRYFTQTIDHILLPVIRALHRGDQVAVWEEYSKLVSTGQRNRIARTVFSRLLHSLHPVTYFKRIPLGTQTEFIHRVDTLRTAIVLEGFTVTTVDWAHILECARALGRPHQSKFWWRTMLNEGISPDVDCYNSYLACVCGPATQLQFEGLSFIWNSETGEYERVKLPNLRRKGRGKLPRKKVGRESSVFATRVVQEMISRGVPPDHYTYGLLISAHAKDLNLPAVESLVNNLWLPDTASSPALRPNEHSLTVIANAYGYNGEVTQASRIIDTLAQKYDIQIPISTYLSLLLWSARRSKPSGRMKRGRLRRVGILPTHLAPDLLSKMLEWKIKPGVDVFWIIIRHEYRTGRYDSAEEFLLTLWKLYGPRGTELENLPPDQAKRLKNLTFSGTKNWIPILVDAISRHKSRILATTVWRTWQLRLLEALNSPPSRPPPLPTPAIRTEITLPMVKYPSHKVPVPRLQPLPSHHKQSLIRAMKTSLHMLSLGYLPQEVTTAVGQPPRGARRARDAWNKWAWSTEGGKTSLVREVARERMRARGMEGEVGREDLRLRRLVKWGNGTPVYLEARRRFKEIEKWVGVPE
jgi:Mitochondrial ATPase expression